TFRAMPHASRTHLPLPSFRRETPLGQNELHYRCFLKSKSVLSLASHPDRTTLSPPLAWKFSWLPVVAPVISFGTVATFSIANQAPGGGVALILRQPLQRFQIALVK